MWNRVKQNSWGPTNMIFWGGHTQSEKLLVFRHKNPAHIWLRHLHKRESLIRSLAGRFRRHFVLAGSKVTVYQTLDSDINLHTSKKNNVEFYSIFNSKLPVSIFNREIFFPPYFYFLFFSDSEPSLGFLFLILFLMYFSGWCFWDCVCFIVAYILWFGHGVADDELRRK